MLSAGSETTTLSPTWTPGAQLPSPDIAGGRHREAVLKHMVHRPCGSQNVDAACMETNKTTKKKKCNEHFHQPFRSTAVVNEHTGRAEYKRIDNVTAPLFVNLFVVNG